MLSLFMLVVFSELRGFRESVVSRSVCLSVSRACFFMFLFVFLWA